MAKKHTINKKNLGEAVVKLERKLAKARKEYERGCWLYDDGKITRNEYKMLYDTMTQLEEDLADIRALHESWHDNPTFIAVEL